MVCLIYRVFSGVCFFEFQKSQELCILHRHTSRESSWIQWIPSIGIHTPQVRYVTSKAMGIKTHFEGHKSQGKCIFSLRVFATWQLNLGIMMPSWPQKPKYCWVSWPDFIVDCAWWFGIEESWWNDLKRWFGELVNGIHLSWKWVFGDSAQLIAYLEERNKDLCSQHQHMHIYDDIDVFSMLSIDTSMNWSSTHKSLLLLSYSLSSRWNFRGSGEYRMAVASANSQVRKPRICENGDGNYQEITKWKMFLFNWHGSKSWLLCLAVPPIIAQWKIGCCKTIVAPNNTVMFHWAMTMMIGRSVFQKKGYMIHILYILYVYMYITPM